jgi:hypothetical protein
MPPRTAGFGNRHRLELNGKIGLHWGGRIIVHRECRRKNGEYLVDRDGVRNWARHASVATTSDHLVRHGSIRLEHPIYGFHLSVY